jgi:hypothetical protein
LTSVEVDAKASNNGIPKKALDRQKMFDPCRSFVMWLGYFHKFITNREKNAFDFVCFESKRSMLQVDCLKA